ASRICAPRRRSPRADVWPTACGRWSCRARASSSTRRRREGSTGASSRPGSGLGKHQAEEEGLDRISLEAGFEWREPGCSNCMSMNNDRAMNGERIASTSNRNLEGRQGKNAKTHLMGPAMAAAAAITGHLTDVRDLG